ncbi:WG repeat-containing protein [bacterium]|nr:MAG: WG repeat-containing protein [bacterium]
MNKIIFFTLICVALFANKAYSQEQLYPVFQDGKVQYINKEGVLSAVSNNSALYTLSMSMIDNKTYFMIKDYENYLFHDGVLMIDLGTSNMPLTYGNVFEYYDLLNNKLFSNRCVDFGFPAERLIPVSISFMKIIPTHNMPWTYIDYSGKPAFNKKFDYADSFNNGLARVKSGDYWGIIDNSGEYKINPEFSSLLSFSEGLAAAKKDAFYGFINESGNWAIQPTFENAWTFSNGLARVLVNSKYRFVLPNGDYLDSNEWDYATDFSNGYAIVGTHSEYHFINTNGEIVKSDFQRGSSFSSGYAAICVDGKWGYVNKKFEWVIEPIFAYAHPFQGDLAIVWLDEQPFYINANNEKIYDVLSPEDIKHFKQMN